MLQRRDAFKLLTQAERIKWERDEEVGETRKQIYIQRWNKCASAGSLSFHLPPYSLKDESQECMNESIQGNMQEGLAVLYLLLGSLYIFRDTFQTLKQTTVYFHPWVSCQRDEKSRTPGVGRAQLIQNTCSWMKHPIMNETSDNDGTSETFQVESKTCFTIFCLLHHEINWSKAPS